MRLKNIGLFVLVMTGMASQVAYSQSPNPQLDRAIEQYTCKDVLREAGASRDVAIAFLHGFLLGKSGSSKFNVEALQKQTDAFVDGCLDSPQAKAEDVMARIKNDSTKSR